MKQKKYISLRRREHVHARLFDRDKKICHDLEFPKHAVEQEIISKGGKKKVEEMKRL